MWCFSSHDNSAATHGVPGICFEYKVVTLILTASTMTSSADISHRSFAFSWKPSNSTSNRRVSPGLIIPPPPCSVTINRHARQSRHKSGDGTNNTLEGSRSSLGILNHARLGGGILPMLAPASLWCLLAEGARESSC